MTWYFRTGIWGRITSSQSPAVSLCKHQEVDLNLSHSTLASHLASARFSSVSVPLTKQVDISSFRILKFCNKETDKATDA